MSENRKSHGLIAELNRRNVFRVAIAYVLVGWVLLQIADVLFPALTLPDWTIRFVAGLLILGFPLVVFFAWAFELTPEGLKREHEVPRGESITHKTARKLNVALVGILVLALGFSRSTNMCGNKRRPRTKPKPSLRSMTSRSRYCPSST